MMKRILELNLGAMILLTFAVGCGGSSSDSGGGGASSHAGSPGSPNGGTANGGAPGSSGAASGGAHSGGQSNPGPGGASNGDGFTTSVPGSTPLKDLTPDQLMQLCDDAKNWTEGSLSPIASDVVCKAQGLAAAAQATTDAAAQTACTDSLTACVPDVNSDPGMCSPTTAETCTATVADLALCANDTAAAFKAFGAALPSCDGITPAKAQAALAAFAGSDTGGFTEPASCTKYNSECPGSMSGM